MVEETTDELALRVECAVILELLGRTAAVSYSDLHERIKGAERAEVEQAVTSLARVGVIRDDDGDLMASNALKRLDDLGMIPV